jgi:ABC-2 type transport system ATP-binding protein
MPSPVIKVTNLRKSYKNFEAVKGISFSVENGEIFGILGPNGAGKTTTLEMIEGLKHQTSGTIEVLGFDNANHPDEIKKHIGVQLQSSEYLPMLSLGELLVLFASLYKKSINPKEALAKVGLEDKIHSRFKELSGGQAQRFTIATALVHDPEIIFLDEPTTGLDPHARRDAWELIKQLNESGITIVMTTHYMEEAEYLCDRIAIMENGAIIKSGTPKELVESISQAYKLSFFVSRAGVPTLLANVPGVSSIADSEYPKISMEIENPEAASAIIKVLRDNQVYYSFLNLKTANLEDVYLQATGREYGEQV